MYWLNNLEMAARVWKFCNKAGVGEWSSCNILPSNNFWWVLRKAKICVRIRCTQFHTLLLHVSGTTLHIFKITFQSSQSSVIMPIVAHSMYIITAPKNGTSHKHALCAFRLCALDFLDCTQTCMDLKQIIVVWPHTGLCCIMFEVVGDCISLRLKHHHTHCKSQSKAKQNRTN